MDYNIVVLSGTLAAPPERRTLDSGATTVRYLVAVRTGEPRRRIDVVPVTVWDPAPDPAAGLPIPGRRIHVAGAVQRRFQPGGAARRSRIEIVATSVCFRDQPDVPPFVGPIEGEQE